MLSARRTARAGAVTVLAAFLGSLLPAATAHAADRAVRGGRLDWGVKSSFQSYVTGPIAQGSYTLQGGAATVGASQFRFHSATGSYNPDTGALSAGFSGGVRFLGHPKNGGHELDLTVARPTVRISGGRGTLYADMTSKAKGTGQVTTSAQVPLATLDVSGIEMRGGGGPIGLSNLPATLTSQGARAFAGYYTAGTALDPVSLSADLLAAARQPSKSPEGEEEKKDHGGKKKDEKEKKAARIEDASVDWGVRRTFREYVTGSIAQGEWKLADGAEDGGALFRFTSGAGTFDKEGQRLDASFEGSVRFTGEHGLDLKLSKVTVAVEDGKGSLRADVRDADGVTKDVPLVTFAVKELEAEDGLVTLTEVPAKLTAKGADAFGSLYKKGTAMDPVSLAVALDEKAELPPLPDLGSADTPTASPEPKKAAAKGKTEPAAAESSSPVLPLAVGAGVVVLAAAGGGLMIARRRRPATPADHPSPQGD
ncbi:HtaA domain-containing protein [Streptomyces sp. CHA1]|uniref:HtaA domain-containing protein n=1 Tax=unclassified Streptomyces TaxID=2593676 RepID=UPI001BFCB080|nr:MULTISPECIES: HtaA domain-containing protein [unclassified Streptomyces]MBT3160741.1 HtaA domain-containing protein [Streptomyces sp. G11C]MCO6703129.1 HtaA domain-containing protein [Streptomyces sp. CHB9.2]MCO6709566.1 HtaA domain-containing protein [Streptomyces sp. CHA3]MCO6715310.1 HtaA domain-containing protein [Streptomyces sp. CHB19.2]MCO6721435.1 HtaA domain-containing protein [Streptomyces sp. Vc714c-19]